MISDVGFYSRKHHFTNRAEIRSWNSTNGGTTWVVPSGAAESLPQLTDPTRKSHVFVRPHSVPVFKTGDGKTVLQHQRVVWALLLGKLRNLLREACLYCPDQRVDVSCLLFTCACAGGDFRCWTA